MFAGAPVLAILTSACVESLIVTDHLIVSSPSLLVTCREEPYRDVLTIEDVPGTALALRTRPLP
jgi:hypothetical protein